jgi:hypothetical protein
MKKQLSFESAEKRSYVTSTLLSAVPNALISCAVVFFLHPQDPILVFLLVFFGIWGVEILLWLRNVMWSWLIFQMLGKKAQSDALLAYLQAHEFPAPSGHYSNAEEYFLEIASDPNASFELRMKALALAVRRRSYGEVGRVTLHIQNAISAEDAIHRYADLSGKR